MCLLYINMDIQ